MFENPTTKIKKQTNKKHQTTPPSHFQCSLFKKGINLPDSRRGGVGQGEKLMDCRKPDSPRGGRRKEERHVMVSWVRHGRPGREKEQRRGAIKTLTLI